jgi:phenylalanyl-tRNA synthetase alpha chain
MELHEYEAAILPFLAKCKSVDELIAKTGLEHIKVMRGLQWLSNKELITLTYEKKTLVELDENGLLYKEKGLPEKRFLEIIKNGIKTLDEIQKSGLSKQEAGVSIGTLKKKASINSVDKKGKIAFEITSAGKSALEKESLEEKFLQKKFPLNADLLSPEEKFAYDNLKSRKQILNVETKNIAIFNITNSGEALLKKGLDKGESVSRLTSKMLKDGSWKEKKFRSFDLNSRLPALNGAKRHYLSQAIDYIKKVWLEMGFEQMDGNIIQSAFWDLDSLFVPQDHPARTMQDTFYLKKPSKEALPAVAKKIKQVHENGGDTGSLGWQTPWSTEEASQLMLRTHCTVLSAQTINKLKESDLPKKFFAVGPVFRNESMDATHLFEFYQVEGIVVDPNVSFSDLLGYLKKFFLKLGYPDVRIRPGYFPYTEPSAEVDVWHPVLNKWVELGGSGVFRPELVKPLLGKAVPVLAWGIGLERGIMENLKINDIRDIYKTDIKETRSKKYWMK